MPGPASPEERLHSSAPDALLSGGRYKPRTDHTGARRREYAMSTRLNTIEFSLNVSLNPLNSVTKIFVFPVNGFEPAIFCGRNQDATAVPARQI